ncbi:MAG: hypothetical protein K1X89_30355, partial [Myxococcaceae bacterium]|nr:hypothetical protein [Myxococcaceae bacterium]
RVAGDEGSRRVLIGSARAAWLAVPGSGSRLEGQVAVRAWSGQLFGGGGEVLLGAPLGGGTLAPGALDGARLSVQVHPLDRLSLQADGRYQSGAAGGFSDAAMVVVGRSFRASADATFDLLPSLSLSLRGGGARQVGAAVSQLYVGPVVTWSPGDLGLQLGYLEELGWLRGRSASLGVWVSFARRVRLQARGGWFEQQNTAAASGFAGRDFGASVLLDADLTSWLSLRVSALGRTSPQSTGLASALDAALELSARF